MTEFDLADRIELLVEGELHADERLKVLAECESHPEQWKTLALAFLDQQRIRDAIRGAQTVDRPPTRVDTVSSPRSTPSWKMGLGLAACLFIAFTVGVGAGQQTTKASRVAGDAAMLSPTGSSNVQVQDSNVAADAATRQDDAPQPATTRDRNGIVGYVHWKGSEGKVRLSPVFVGQIDAAWLEENPPQVNQKMRRMMSRAGWQVEAERRLVSVNLESGDQFTIPMDDVLVRYVGKQVL